MIKKVKILMVMLVLSSTIIFQGCVALIVGAGAGAAGIAYIRGILEKNFDRPVSDLYNASLKALDSLKMTVDSKELKDHEATIKAHDSKKNGITIIAESLTEKASKLKIRVGLFGDQDRSLNILNAVEKRL
jgi:hypothetical protein